MCKGLHHGAKEQDNDEDGPQLERAVCSIVPTELRVLGHNLEFCPVCQSLALPQKVLSAMHGTYGGNTKHVIHFLQTVSAPSGRVLLFDTQGIQELRRLDLRGLVIRSKRSYCHCLGKQFFERIWYRHFDASSCGLYSDERTQDGIGIKLD